jgi:hypothetical protein
MKVPKSNALLTTDKHILNTLTTLCPDNQDDFTCPPRRQPLPRRHATDVRAYRGAKDTVREPLPFGELYDRGPLYTADVVDWHQNNSSLQQHRLCKSSYQKRDGSRTASQINTNHNNFFWLGSKYTWKQHGGIMNEGKECGLGIILTRARQKQQSEILYWSDFLDLSFYWLPFFKIQKASKVYSPEIMIMVTFPEEWEFYNVGTVAQTLKFSVLPLLSS